MTVSRPDRAVAFSVQLAQAHQELRRRISRLQAGLGDTSTLATHCLAFCAALTSHHQGEDAGMFAELARARPDLAGKIAKLVEDHEMIGTILERVADLAEKARGAQGAELARLKGELDGLAAIMESHFRFEERAVSAALDEGVADTGWTEPVFGLRGVGLWKNTTHDWAATVDIEHLAGIRAAPDEFAAGGTVHLILEVLAYAAEEAESAATPGRCVVTLASDGSVTVADDGRGTSTGHDPDGRPVRKPIMATRDLRFFDHPDAQRLPDGHPRRGISTVAALSQWLVHTNHRRDGAWTQRYEHGIPVTDLLPVPPAATTGTTVRFLPADEVPPTPGLSAGSLRRLAAAWPQLHVEVVDERSGSAG